MEPELIPDIEPTEPFEIIQFDILSTSVSDIDVSGILIETFKGMIPELQQMIIDTFILTIPLWAIFISVYAAKIIFYTSSGTYPDERSNKYDYLEEYSDEGFDYMSEDDLIANAKEREGW